MPHLERLGRYEIVAELGEGAMGTVYKAIDPKLDRIVALKTVRMASSHPDFREFSERFLAEAKSAGRLSHPNIVTIHDFGEVGEVAFIAMEFLRGETLRQMLDRQRFSSRRAVRYAIQIADGLDAAHLNGVVHRDIKPANIVRLENGQLKITDFGIAQLHSNHLTMEGTLLGTPNYMSPEQIRGMRVDGRSDIFSLGVVLYEMLTHTLPFGGATLAALMYQIVNEPPIHPKRWNAAIPDDLGPILSKCLAKDADNRYQRASELAHDLRVFKDEVVAEDADDNVFLPLNPREMVSGFSATLAAPLSAMSKLRRHSATVPLDQTSPIPDVIEPEPAAPSARLRLTHLMYGGLALCATGAVAILGYLFLPGHDGAHNTAADTATLVSPVEATTPTLIAPDASMHANFDAPPDASSDPIAPPRAATAASGAMPATPGTDASTARKSKRAVRAKPADQVTPVAAAAAVAEPVAAPVAVTPSAAPAEPAPSGFAGFLKTQRDCIVEHKCAPPRDPNEIRN